MLLFNAKHSSLGGLRMLIYKLWVFLASMTTGKTMVLSAVQDQIFQLTERTGVSAH